MDLALIIVGVIGVLMFGAYIFLIYKTSKDDERNKKLEGMGKNGHD